MPYQVIQRDGSGEADIEIAGTFGAGTHDVEARWNGGSWTTIATDAVGSFSGTLAAQPQGQGTLEVRLVDEPLKGKSVEHVGIGDVFILAGQSNVSGYTIAPAQLYSHATLKATLFGNDYRWGNLQDPTDTATGQVDTVSADPEAQAGTLWPLLATHIMADQGVPVAFVPCAKGGTSIAMWQPGASHTDRSTLYGSMVYRALQTGARAILWHQGESDATINGFTGGTAYNALLDSFAAAIAADLNIPIIAARIHKWNGAPDTTQGNVDEINAAIDTAITDNANLLTGPHFDSPPLTTAPHFTTEADLIEAASRWWAAIEGALYP